MACTAVRFCRSCKHLANVCGMGDALHLVLCIARAAGGEMDVGQSSLEVGDGYVGVGLMRESVRCDMYAGGNLIRYVIRVSGVAHGRGRAGV